MLVRRLREPHALRWALPGGFVREKEETGPAALREVSEKTTLPCAYALTAMQVGAFADPLRDPRGRCVSLLHTALSPLHHVDGTNDANDAHWFDVHDLPDLAFDHAQLVGASFAYLRRRIESAAFSDEPSDARMPVLPGGDPLDSDTALSLASLLATAPSHVAYQEQQNGERDFNHTDGPAW